MIFVGREIKIIRGGNYGPAARKWKWKREYRINLGPRGGIIIPLGLFYILFNLLRGIEKPLPSMAHGFLCLGPHPSAPRPLADFIPFKSIFSTLRSAIFPPENSFSTRCCCCYAWGEEGKEERKKEKKNSRDANVLINAPPRFADETFDD